MRKKTIYMLVKDGRLLPDSHLLIFENPISALVSLLLFSVTYACKDLKLYKVGDLTDDLNTFEFGSYRMDFFCDFHNVKSLFTEYSANKDFTENVEINEKYINDLIDLVDLAIKNQFISNEEVVNGDATNE